MDTTFVEDKRNEDKDLVEVLGDDDFGQTSKTILKQTKLSFDQLPNMRKISVNSVNAFNLGTEKKWIVELFPFFDLVKKESTGKNQVKATMKCKSCFLKSGKTSLIVDKGTFGFKRHLEVNL